MKRIFGKKLMVAFLMFLFGVFFVGCGTNGIAYNLPDESPNKNPQLFRCGDEGDVSDEVQSANLWMEESVFGALSKELKKEWNILAQKSSEPVTVSLDETTQIPTFISGSFKTDAEIDAESTDQEAAQVLETFKCVLMAGDVNETFAVESISESDGNNTHIRYQEYFSNLKVFGGGVIVHLRDGNTISSFSGGYVPLEALKTVDSTPTLSLDETVVLAMKAFEESGAEAFHCIIIEGEECDLTPTGELLVYDRSLFMDNGNNPRLSWLIDLKNGYEFFIDAKTGEILDSLPTVID